MVLVPILISTLLVSVVSLVGIFTLSLKKKFFENILFGLIGFSAGSLIGSAFLHILPEALEDASSITVFYCVISGLVLFFFLEKYFYWRHCHNGHCEVHAFTYLNLLGDGVHNFIDGMVIAASYVSSVQLGIVTTIAVILHEIPQELGDYGVLIYGGFSHRKALAFNFLCALMALFGAVIGYLISDMLPHMVRTILPLTAGGFIYIATSDLIPELHKQGNTKRSLVGFFTFLAGIAFMAVVRHFSHH